MDFITTSLSLPLLSILKTSLISSFDINDLVIHLLHVFKKNYAFLINIWIVIYVLEQNTLVYLFFFNTKKSTFYFNSIYCDIWGGYHTISHSGAHYFLTIMDDFSRTTWVYLIHMKSDTFTCLTNIFAMVKTQFNCIIRHMHTNNGQ